jgi:hypothetical protein
MISGTSTDDATDVLRYTGYVISRIIGRYTDISIEIPSGRIVYRLCEQRGPRGETKNKAVQIKRHSLTTAACAESHAARLAQLCRERVLEGTSVLRSS